MLNKADELLEEIMKLEKYLNNFDGTKMIRGIAKEVAIVYDFLYNIMNDNEDLISAVDKDNKIIFFNKAYKKKFSSLFVDELIVGRDISLILKNNFSQILDSIDKSLGGKSFSIEKSIGGKHYEIVFIPIKNKYGEIIASGQIYRDVSYRVELQNKVVQNGTKIS